MLGNRKQKKMTLHFYNPFLFNKNVSLTMLRVSVCLFIRPFQILNQPNNFHRTFCNIMQFWGTTTPQFCCLLRISELVIQGRKLLVGPNHDGQHGLRKYVTLRQVLADLQKLFLGFVSTAITNYLYGSESFQRSYEVLS